MKYTDLSISSQKEFISDVIDLCLYNEEGFKKLQDLIKEEGAKGLNRRTTFDSNAENLELHHSHDEQPH